MPTTPSIQLAYDWAIYTCNRPDVGYSQAYRNQKRVNDITYYDCSSFIWFALIAGGFDCEGVYGDDWPMVTATENQFLEDLGFTESSINGLWKPGDILWRSGHTEMVYSGGQAEGVTMGAHSSHRPLEDQVSINDFVSTSSSWTRLWRYGDTDITPPDDPFSPTPIIKKDHGMPVWMMTRKGNRLL